MTIDNTTQTSLPWGLGLVFKHFVLAFVLVPWGGLWMMQLTFNIRKILLGGLVSTVGILAMGFALGWLAPHETPLKDFSPSDLKWLGWLSLAVAPIIEETVFRGYLQGTLISKFSTWQSVLITALVFTAMHGVYYTHWAALLYVFGVGILLSLVRNKTQSIWPGMLGHFINNLLALQLN
jgi:membrane protease YdiL (CAAX protease family)